MNYLLFLEGKIADDKGRYLDKYFSFSNLKLEYCHNYIQRIFPINEMSKADKSLAPLSLNDINEIKKSDIAKNNIKIMYEKMLIFFKLDDKNYTNWNIKRHWNKINNHNHRRITRMLICFKLLDLEDLQKDFSIRLKYPIENNLSINISNQTRKIWEKNFI